MGQVIVGYGFNCQVCGYGGMGETHEEMTLAQEEHADTHPPTGPPCPACRSELSTRPYGWRCPACDARVYLPGNFPKSD